MTSSPQQRITQSLRLNHKDILTLNSSPFIIVPAEVGFVNILTRASLSYIYRDAVFTNVDDLLSFVLLQEDGTSVLVSNSLNALNILGIDQNTNITFSPANPYSPLLSSSTNAPLALRIGGSDPMGGSIGSSLLVSFTYDVYEL